MQFKYHSTDTGFCRVYYTFKTPGSKGKPFLYCWQDDGRSGKIDLKFYRCSQLWYLEGEPEYEVTPKPGIKFERPEQSDIGDALIALLEEQDRLQTEPPHGLRFMVMDAGDLVIFGTHNGTYHERRLNPQQQEQANLCPASKITEEKLLKAINIKG